MEGQRNECLEAASFILQLSQTKQMVDSMLCLLHVAVQHGCVGAQTKLMSRTMHVEPDITVGFVFTDLTSHFFVKDLCTTTGHAAEAGFHHLLKYPLDRLLGDEAEPTDFDRSPGLDMNLRTCFVDDSNDVQIPVETLLMMQTADHMDLRRAGVATFENSIANHLVGERVSFLISQVRAECTESTAIDTDVGRVQVNVRIVECVVAVDAFSNSIGESSKCVQIGTFIENHTVVK